MFAVREKIVLEWLKKTYDVPGIWLVRACVGLIFLSEGIQKFLFAETLGSGRFEKIGLPLPHILGPFVGGVEIICGTLLTIGLLTKLSSIPLLIVISTAIATTKVAMFADKGFWGTLHDSRTDFAMLMCLIFLLIAGGGRRSVDALFLKRRM